LDIVFRLTAPLVERTCVQVQRKYWHAPNLAGVGANDGVVCAGLG
jgi:hypothetical protein